MHSRKLSLNPRSLRQRPSTYIIIVLVVYLVVGALIVTHFGESWDEPLRYEYARRSLAAYSGVSSNLADEKGPFFNMLGMLGANGLQLLVSGWKWIDGWHFMTYLSFLMGVYFFYRLCRRLVEPGPALAATLLFSTQPVIWGHAFMNPKDIPFMSFFLASVTLGLDMADHYSPQGNAPGAWQLFHGGISQDWQSAPRHLRRLWMAMLFAWVALLLAYPFVQSAIAGLAAQVYNAPAESWIKQFLSAFDPNASLKSPLTYTHKAQTLDTILFAIILIGISLALILVGRRMFNVTAGRFSGFSFRPRTWLPNLSAWVRARLAALRRDLPSSWNAFGASLRNLAGRVWKAVAQPRVILAACFLGFCSAIRTLGPASGLLVAVYFLFKSRQKAIPVLLVYFGIGALVTYLFWPYLWSSPVGHYLAAFSQAENFEGVATITFNGLVYPGENPPTGYLPTLIGLQFTETALALVLVGVILAGVLLWKRRGPRLEILLLLVWFAAPPAAAIYLRSNLYNNFRQFLFIIPPLFILASLGLQPLWTLLKLLNQKAVFVLLAGALLLPGLYWDFALHPYEYIYYNGLTGGVNGAFRLYDLDYWATSYKEDLEFLNAVAPQNAVVLADGQDLIAIPYARSDLKILSRPLPPGSAEPNYYAVIQAINDRDETFYPESKVIFQVKRGDAILSVVKQVRPGDFIGHQ